MKLKNIALITALCLCGFASHASAAIVKVAYTGVVTDDLDMTGEFGAAGGIDNLVGDVYAATYIFDTSLGATLNLQGGTAILGGTGVRQGGVSPIISNSVTVNGYTQSLPGSWESEVLASATYGGVVAQEVVNTPESNDI